MIRQTTLALCVLLCLQCGHVTAIEMEISLRPHAKRIFFGDPLYVEVAITNSGRVGIAASPKYYHGDRFRFEFRDHETGLLVWQFNAVGQPSPRDVQPQGTARFIQCPFLPRITDIDHVFWKPFQSGQSILIFGVYPLTPSGLHLRSIGDSIVIEQRSEAEMLALRRWMSAGGSEFEKGPRLNDLGLGFLRAVGHKDIVQMATEIKSGEIADLLSLTIQMQEIYALPDDERAGLNDQLVKWLRGMTPIKRQCLALQTRGVAESYAMPSTQIAIERLLAEVPTIAFQKSRVLD